MNTYKAFIKLFRRLCTTSVFYVPQVHVPEEAEDMMSLRISDYTDRLLYVKEDRTSCPLQNPEAFENILQKKFKLDQTVVYLLKQKKKLDKKSFSYLLDKYFEYLNIMLLVAKLLNEHVSKYFPNEAETIYHLFRLQYNTVVDHREQMIKTFEICDTKLLSLDDLFNMSLLKYPELNDLILSDENSKPGASDSGEVVSTDQLITDEQARDFLLERVFFIDKGAN